MPHLPCPYYDQNCEGRVIDSTVRCFANIRLLVVHKADTGSSVFDGIFNALCSVCSQVALPMRRRDVAHYCTNCDARLGVNTGLIRGGLVIPAGIVVA